MSVRRFLAGLIGSLGFMVALLSGGCTVIWWVLVIGGFVGGGWDNILGGIQMGAGIGGIPFIVGLILFLIGKKLKSADKEIEESNLDDLSDNR